MLENLLDILGKSVKWVGFKILLIFNYTSGLLNGFFAGRAATLPVEA